MRKFLTFVIAALFIACGIYIHSLYIMVEHVRAAQKERGIEFEAIRTQGLSHAPLYDTTEENGINSAMLYDVFVNRQLVATFENLSDAKEFAANRQNASIFEQQSLSWVWDNHPQFELHINNVRMLYHTFLSAREEAVNHDDAFIVFRRSGRRVWDSAFSPSVSHFIEGVPLILQQPRLNRGCGVVSLAMLLNYMGIEVCKMDLAQEIATHPNNPFKGFVGDIYSWNNWGYGVYHGPIYDLLYKYLPDRAIDITGGDFEDLLFFIEKGSPVWVVVNTRYTYLPPYQWVTHQTDDGPIQITWRMHAVLVTGFDENTIFFNDPNNVQHSANRANFQAAWEQIGRQAVTIS